MDSLGISVPEHTGLGELAPAVLFEIYPNPTDGIVSLTLEFLELSDFEIEVQNLMGEILISKSFSDTKNLQAEINLGELSHGVYVIKLVANNGVMNKGMVVVR